MRCMNNSEIFYVPSIFFCVYFSNFHIPQHTHTPHHSKLLTYFFSPCSSNGNNACNALSLPSPLKITAPALAVER